jgi:hypothetical protein
MSRSASTLPAKSAASSRFPNRVAPERPPQVETSGPDLWRICGSRDWQPAGCPSSRRRQSAPAWRRANACNSSKSCGRSFIFHPIGCRRARKTEIFFLPAYFHLQRFSSCTCFFAVFGVTGCRLGGPSNLLLASCSASEPNKLGEWAWFPAFPTTREPHSFQGTGGLIFSPRACA